MLESIVQSPFFVVLQRLCAAFVAQVTKNSPQEVRRATTAQEFENIKEK